MLIPEHKYLVSSCSGMLKTKDEKHQYIVVELIKPAPTDDFGEKIMDDDVFRCTSWNKAAQALPILKKGDKVSAQLALRGSMEASKNDGTQTFNRLQLTIRKLEKIAENE